MRIHSIPNIFVFITLLFLVGCSDSESSKQHEAAQRLLVQGALSGNIQAMDKALSSGANVNETWMTNMPLYWASNEGQNEAINYLLKAGADINGLSGVANRSALHEAALRGYLETVKLLVENGADIHIKNTHNRTPLYYVTTPPAPLSKPINADQIAEYLISNGASQ